MSALPESLDAADRRLARRRRPRFHAPMLATLTDERISDSGWRFELKCDGERTQAIRDGDNLELVSRTGRTLNATYPKLVDALRHQQTERFVVDGEVVALDEHGVPSFARLQGRMRRTYAPTAMHEDVAVVYYLFDLLHVDSYDVAALALSTRKALLRRAITLREPLRYSDHQVGDGKTLLDHAWTRGSEDLITKRPDSPYVESRSSDWLKFKCVRSQEFVVGGFSEPKGSRVGLRALLVGYYDHDELVYAGMVGTGFDAATLTSLAHRLHAIERSTSPFVRGATPRSGVHWFRPQLVCDIAFTEWTGDGRLRHGRFQGLRRDKPAHEVVRERPRRAA
jgi:bifunctional non-homologous end joining protein LigD